MTTPLQMLWNYAHTFEVGDGQREYYMELYYLCLDAGADTVESINAIARLMGMAWELANGTGNT